MSASPRARAAGLALAAFVAGATNACSDDGGASSGAPAPSLAWTPCNVDYECATIQVPVDYAAPEGETIALALTRAPAAVPEERLGVIVVNPGGPGIPMVDQLARQYRAMKIAFPVALDRFDIVAFDWRGIGHSRPVECVDGAFFDRLRGLDLTLEDPASRSAVDEARRTLVAGCRARASDAVLSNLHTENAARDLDRIRVALGEEKLNYLGFSYGTVLGATYATLYPDRVRAFALDSAIVLEGDLQGQLQRRSEAFELGLTRFFDACARDNACAFHGGETATAIASKLDALVTRVRTTPGGLPAGARRLSIVDFHYAMADGLRNGAPSKLAVDLAKAEAGDASALLARADLVAGRRADADYDSTIVGLVAIACLDQPFAPGTSIEGLHTFVHGLAPAPRSAGAIGIPFALCVDWPWKRTVPARPIDARSAPPLLVVAGRNDPISSYAMAAPLLARLANGSHLVTYEGDGHSVSLRSACIRDAVTAFMLDPTKPPKAATCPAE
ncbi:MAG: alpha/beta fold hydrolase [Deltaproteobacteria bacterium]|nr:alpha/beta fold hydrolase [Deltaproteobacteria bacterium]